MKSTNRSREEKVRIAPRGKNINRSREEKVKIACARININRSREEKVQIAYARIKKVIAYAQRTLKSIRDGKNNRSREDIIKIATRGKIANNCFNLTQTFGFRRLSKC